MIIFYSFLISIPYIYKSLECLYGLIILHNKKSSVPKNNVETASLSIIIAYKDEEANLPSLIECLNNQTHKAKEIIFVNDNSQDNSLKIIQQLTEHSSQNYILIDSKGTGKKAALATAVNYTNSEYCLFTDADCSFSSAWTETYNNHISAQLPDMIISSVHEISNSTFISKLQTIEFESLQACTASSCATNRPIMCNGANMCVKRSIWLENYNNGLLGKKESGDDVFMLHAIKRNKGKIFYIANQDSEVNTPTAKSIVHFLNQRMRWGGKSLHYKDLNSISYALIVFSFALFITFLSIACFFSNKLLIPFFTLLLIKIIADFAVLYYQHIKNKLDIKPYHIILFSLLHSPYIVFTALGGFLNIYKWKK